jgi:hypothetical protein
MNLHLGPQKMNQKCGKSKIRKPEIGIVLYIKVVNLLNKNSICEMTASNMTRIKNGSTKNFVVIRITHNIISVTLEVLMVVTIKIYCLLRCYVVQSGA